MQEERSVPSERLYFNVLHVLRGLAALWVVLFHIHSFGLVNALKDSWPSAVYAMIFEFGRGGVAVFFVLSGVVIAHSQHGKNLDGRGFVQFFVRRSIRLDPPYYVSIVLTLLFLALVGLASDRPVSLPSAANVVAHMAYLQDILGFEPISTIYWTLAYEIQFYLVFAAMQLLSLVLARKFGRAAALSLSCVAYAIALAGAWWGPEWAPKGVFLNYWFAFYLGVLVYGAAVHRQSPIPALVLAALTLWTAADTTEVFNTPAAVTAILILVLGRLGRLNFSHMPRALLWTGSISYSLYLIHYLVLLATLPFAYRLVGSGIAGSSYIVLFAELIATLIAAYVMWRLIERPCQEFSKRFTIAGIAGKTHAAHPPSQRN